MPDRAYVHSLIDSRNRWLNSAKVNASSMWSDGPDSAAATSGATSASPLYFGSFRIPPASTEEGLITINSLVTYPAATANTFRYEIHREHGNDGDWSDALFSGDVIAATGKLGGVTAWYSDIFFHPSPREWLVVHVFTNAIVHAGTKLNAVTLVEGPSSGASATWPTNISTAAIGTPDRPDDAYLLRWIQRAQEHVMTRYPRTIGCHTFEDRTSAVATAKSYQYLVARGPRTDVCQLWVRAYISGAGNGTLAAFCDTGAGTTATGTNVATVTSTPAWFSIPDVGGWTANSPHVFKLTATPPAARTITVTDIVLVENEAPASAFVYTTGGRNDPVPERFFPLDAGRVGDSAPIVAGYRLGTTQARWTDRQTLAQNAIFCAHRRVASLVGDRIGRNGATGAADANTNSTRGAYPTAAAAVESDYLWQGKHQTSRGASSLQVFIRPRRVGVTDKTLQPRFALDMGTGAGMTEVPGATRDYVTGSLGTQRVHGPSGVGPFEAWVPIGAAIAVTEGQTYELGIRAGFLAITTGVGTGSADAAVLDGVVVVEVAAENEASKVYFYGANTAAVNIPGSSFATRTVASAAEFTARHLRVRVDLTHTGGTNLEVKLTSPTGTSCILRVASVTASLALWYSDDNIGDTSPANPLSVFAGETSLGTWTLTATDTAGVGTVGSITGFGVEIS